MRIIVPGPSKVACAKAVMKKADEGWNPISKIQLDMNHHDEIRFVCLMEKPDTPELKELNKKRRFNRGSNSFL